MCSIQEKYEKPKYAEENYELSLETIKDLIPQAVDMGIKRLFLIGGEPFLREDLFEIINFAHDYNMETIVFTNGTLLDNTKVVRRILDLGLHKLTISFDGACENTYRSIRGIGLFEMIKSNIQLINKMKRDRNSYLPIISIFCTIMNQNIEELIDSVYLAQQLELDGIDFQPVVMDNTNQRLRSDMAETWILKSRYNIIDKSIDKLLEYKVSNKDNLKFIYS